MGASRFAFNQCVVLVKQALDARDRDESGPVPWTKLDLINAFNGWKCSAAAGRLMVVDTAGVTELQTTGLVWRDQVCQQVFEEAAADCARGLARFSASRRSSGSRLRVGHRVGFPRFKRRPRTPGVSAGSFRIRQKTSAKGVPSVRVGEVGPRSVRLPIIGVLRVREDTRRLRRLLDKDRGRITSVTVKARAGRWTISVNVEAADLHPDRQHPATTNPGGWVGVDRGLTTFVVAADRHGREVVRATSSQAWRAGLPRLRRLARQVSRRQRGSKNRGKAATRLARQHARIRNLRQEFLHQVAHQLVQTHDRLVLEDLNIRGMVHNHTLAAGISDAAWAEIARIIGYQQEWRGGQLTLADRWFPSSKTCSACRSLVAALPLSVRTFQCPSCGFAADRDLNAAINLAVWAEEHDAQSRDPEVRGPDTNAYRATHRNRTTRGAADGGCDDVGIPPSPDT